MKISKEDGPAIINGVRVDKEEWRRAVEDDRRTHPLYCDRHADDRGEYGTLWNGVDHPGHYNMGNIEAIDVIEDWNLNFHCGNAIKYISRHKHKESPRRDIEKAIWYLKRYMEKM